MVLIVRKTNWVHTIRYSFIKMQVSITLPSMPRLSKWSVYIQVSYSSLLTHVSTCHTFLILLNLTTLITGEGYKLWSSKESEVTETLTFVTLWEQKCYLLFQGPAGWQLLEDYCVTGCDTVWCGKVKGKAIPVAGKVTCQPQRPTHFYLCVSPTSYIVKKMA
jgi:hypothetical protein